MRAFCLLALLLYIVPSLLALVAQIPNAERNEFGVLLARETDPSSTTASEASVDATTTGATTTPMVESNSTSAASTASPSTTSIPSLNDSEPLKDDAQNSTTPGMLPLKPAITPALGVSGFILITTGAILALIGIRNLWVQVFLSSAFLTSLGVTVLIVYVMNPPVRVAIQGAYLVAVFFTGITFGGLSIVFKELTEGLGCLLGGFCTSMWLLSTRPGGLLTETDAKSGFIGAISVGFYALSFSHYTRPYGLIVSTAISGGTAVALGIDCYSRAGLKEFWLYIWALNDDIFPLGTNTYPVTRNIRVELAATVIIAIMGVVSQLRLWKVIRERRQKEEERRQEEQREKDEAEAEAVKRLEDNNLKERMEWEAKYGDPTTSSSSPSIPELPDGSRKCAADETDAMEKGESTEMESIGSSESSYRCTECRGMEEDVDNVSDATGTATISETHDGSDTIKQPRTKHRKMLCEEDNEAYQKVFDGADAMKIEDDRNSDVTAIIGSDAASVRSQDFTTPPRKKAPTKAPTKAPENAISEPQEALVPCDDDVSSTQGVVDDVSDIDSDTHTIAAGSGYQAASKAKEPLHESLTACDSKASFAPSIAPSLAPSQRTVVANDGENCRNPATPMQDANLLELSSSNKGPECQRITVPPDQKVSSADKYETERTLITKLEPQQAEAEKEVKPECLDEQPASSKDKPAKANGEMEESKSQAKKTANVLPLPDDQEVVLIENKGKMKSTETCQNKKETTDPGNKKPRDECSKAEESSTTGGVSSEKEDPKLAEDAGQLNGVSKSKKPDTIPPSKWKSSGSTPKAQAKPRKEVPAKLDAETVKHIPKQTSRVVQSYRTNEWAKHLADAETPDLEPILPFEVEQTEILIDDEEVATPVMVTELLQTPLTAQPPPAIEPRTSFGKNVMATNESRRMSTDSLPQLGSQKKKRTSRSPNRLSEMHHSSTYSLPQTPTPVATLLPDSMNSSSTTLISNMGPIEPGREESESAKPRWKGPPPLIAVREGMVRNRLSSFSLGIDPYTRQSPGHSPTDLSPRYSSTFTIPEEEEDDMPLSRRRTMLHQHAKPSQAVAAAPPAPSRWSHSAPSKVNSPEVLAAWRESVREDLREKRNPLKLPVTHNTVGMKGADRSPSPFGQLQQRNASSTSIGDKVAEGMQRGDMSDLHREAMRRMQAKANQKANSRV